jgi:hypothetical protein
VADIVQEAGNSTPSILLNILQEIETGIEDDAFTEEVLRNTTGTMYAGKDRYPRAQGHCTDHHINLVCSGV